MVFFFRSFPRSCCLVFQLSVLLGSSCETYQLRQGLPASLFFPCLFSCSYFFHRSPCFFFWFFISSVPFSFVSLLFVLMSCQDARVDDLPHHETHRKASDLCQFVDFWQCKTIDIQKVPPSCLFLSPRSSASRFFSSSRLKPAGFWLHFDELPGCARQ